MTMRDFYSGLVRNAEGAGAGAAPGGDQAPGAVPAGGGAAEGADGDATTSAAPASLIESAPTEFAEWTPEALTPLVPEGYTVTEEQTSDLLKIVNEAKGDPTKIVGGLLGYYTKISSAAAESMAAEFNQLQSRMQDEVRNDPTYGGPKLDESLRVAKETAARYGGNDFLGLLSATGAGNSIHMVKFLNEVAKALPAEGKPVNGSAATPPKTLSERLWGGSQK